VGRNLAERSTDGVHARGHRGSDRCALEGTPLLSLARSKAPAVNLFFCKNGIKKEIIINSHPKS
jgi:hypothetical protein